MKFVLVTVNDEKYKPLAEWTVHKNRKKYCEKHGYGLYHLEDGAVSIVGKPMRAGNPPIPDDHVPIGWSKIYAVRKAMQIYPDVDWIFASETDCMVTNMDVKLEDIVKEHASENIHFMVPADCNGTNCGNMLIRNSEIGKAFINTIIASLPVYRHWYLFENQFIQDLLVGSHLEETGIKPGGTAMWARVGKVLPQRVMNSYDYKNSPLLQNRPNYQDIIGTDGQWQEGDFLIQWAGTDLEYRLKAAKEMYENLNKKESSQKVSSND